MCARCIFWQRGEATTEQGLVFAPCLLRPPRRVQDRRVPVGFEIQRNITQDDYTCPRFTGMEAT